MQEENKSAQGDNDTPFIKQDFFKEVFESERGSKLIIHGEQQSLNGSDDIEQEEITSPPIINPDPDEDTERDRF